MPVRCGQYTIQLPSRPAAVGWAAIGGKREEKGPMGKEFDQIIQDETMGKNSWEMAESALHQAAVEQAVQKSRISAAQVQMHFAGDLQNQCTGTTFGVREQNIPLVGIYGACSNMALSLAMAALMIDANAAAVTLASTSSHFCAAEKQFRMPLEYGGQRTPTSQWTATAAGAAVLQAKGRGPCVDAVIIGRMQDMQVKDPNNMGAAMAPAACETIADFLRDTKTQPEDYDMILTGDLGAVGSSLLISLLQEQEDYDITGVHQDCGLLLYDCDPYEIRAGGSGCGCSAAVVCSHILRRLSAGELNKVLFVGTGALLSAISSLQGESIPGIAHGVLLCAP